MANWQIRVDWDDDYDFTDTNDDISEDVISFNIRVGMSKAYTSVSSDGLCSVQVKNDTGKYNPENTSSPLFGKIKPFRRIEVKKDGTVVYRGWVRSIKPAWEKAGTYTGKTFATLECSTTAWKMEATDFASFYYENQSADQIITDVVTEIQPPIIFSGSKFVIGKTGYSELGTTTVLGAVSDLFDYQTSISTFTYGDSATSQENHEVDERKTDTKTEGRSAWRIIKDVTEAERGRFFFARDGRATFWNRHHLLGITTVTATVSESGTYKPTQVNYSYGENITNRVRVTCYPRSVDSTDGVLWTLPVDTVLDLAAGETLIYEMVFTDSSGNRSGGKEAKVTEFEHSAENKEDVVYTFSPKGDRGTIYVTNNSEANQQITALEISGKAIKSNGRLSAEVEDSDSILANGKTAMLTLNLTALNDYELAQGIARFELARRKDARADVSSISFLRDVNDDAHLLSWGIGTRLTLNLASKNHNKDYFIIGEQRRIEKGISTTHECTFYLEPVAANTFFIVGTSRLETDTILAV